MTHTEPRSSVSSLPEYCRNRPPRSWFVTRHGCHFVKQRLCLATQTTIELVRTERPATPKSPERHLDDPAQIEPGGRTLLDVNEDTRSLAFAHHAHDVVAGSELFPSIVLSRSNASAPTAVFKLAVVFSRRVQQGSGCRVSRYASAIQIVRRWTVRLRFVFSRERSGSSGSPKNETASSQTRNKPLCAL